MTLWKYKIAHLVISILAPVWLLLGLVALFTVPFAAQSRLEYDPAEPMQNKPNPKILPRPAGAIQRGAVDENSMRDLVERLVACGTRNSLSSWDDPKRRRLRAQPNRHAPHRNCQHVGREAASGGRQVRVYRPPHKQ